MVSGVLLVLLDLLVHVVLTELPVLSGQRVIWALPDPRVKLDRKALLVRRVILENVVLRVSVEKPDPLALLVLLVREWITSGPSR